METVELNIPSITCSACSEKIQEEIGKLQGIDNISVDLKSQTVKVSYTPDNISPQDIKQKITSMGYDVMQ